MAGMSLLAAMAGGLFAQADASGPAFDVASVKVSAPLPPGMVMIRMGGGPDSSDPGRITYERVTLKSLIARAYDVKEFQVEGPQWLDGEHYDIIATIPQGADKAQVGLMMQRLLAERFKLTLHREQKPMAVYTLSVAKGGPKLQEVDPEAPLPAPPPGGPPAPPPPPPPGGVNSTAGRGPMPPGALRMMMGMNNRRLTGNTTIERLCAMLSNLTDRPVIDLTGLKGTYAFDLSWTPDENERMAGPIGMAMARAAGGAPPPNVGPAGSEGKAPEGANDPGQNLVQALQTNYGLKLDAKKNPADILVVDHAEKVPTEN
jgi:uncharacterized protein (TIGR03435 family)